MIFWPTLPNLKIYFSRKKNRVQKINFQTFFRTLKSKNSVFRGFSENHDFRPKTILLNSNIGWKFNFFDEINFQTFFIPGKPTERVFYIHDIFFQSNTTLGSLISGKSTMRVRGCWNFFLGEFEVYTFDFRDQKNARP